MQDFDALVKEVYKRPYCYQQQDGCHSRGVVRFTAPLGYGCDSLEALMEDCNYTRTEIPEVVNGKERGVSFAAWLARDPEKLIPGRDDRWATDLWWHRNFYPNFSILVYDLHRLGHLPDGEYIMIIDW